MIYISLIYYELIRYSFLQNSPNPFSGTETPNHKKSGESMDVSTTTDDFHRPCFDFQKHLDQGKIMLNFWFQILTTRPKWLKIKPVSKMYIYTNTEEALDYVLR